MAKPWRRSLRARARRSQAERDAITVEIGYALLSATVAAALALGAVAGPAFAFGLSGGTRIAFVAAGVAVAALLFVARVVAVLFRFGRRAGTQPSQPGRTSPDS
ncbi:MULTISPECIES: DUF6332 family protein [unclassified Streptomyces]|uniref:DUF6332 family protein n=1 Tax=unclassified Streptomyces TaxID=2593676 RepID=UPI003D92A698